MAARLYAKSESKSDSRSGLKSDTYYQTNISDLRR
jgi:hypothetical protein